MATAFSKLKRAAWNGIEFPVRRVSVRGSLNHHVHVYPHAFGGAFENLQRKLYEIRMTAPMLQRLKNYPDLWPTKWRTMVSQFETGEVGTLDIPTVGRIKARCLSWPEEMDAKIQSGVMVELEFLEDQSQQFLIDSLVEAAGDDQQNTQEALASEVLKLPSKHPGDIFDTIKAVGNAILSIKDQGDLATQLLEQKILGLDALLRQADNTVVDLQRPENYAALNALRELWKTNNKLLKDLQGKRNPLLSFVVPMSMSISDISVRIYGDNSHAVELLQLNAIADAFAIEAGTILRYYPILSTAA